jgi:hypothetical protein
MPGFISRARRITSGVLVIPAEVRISVPAFAKPVASSVSRCAASPYAALIHSPPQLAHGLHIHLVHSGFHAVVAKQASDGAAGGAVTNDDRPPARIRALPLSWRRLDRFL